MFFRELETERLYLTNICPDDKAFIFHQFSDADVTQYLYDEEPFTNPSEAEGLIAFYTMPEPRSQHRWIVTLKESGEKIGTCGFHNWIREAGRAEIGYDLQKAYWGKGLMSEAAAAAVQFAKTYMDLSEIDAHICHDNGRSIALAKKLGFVDKGQTVIYTFRGVPYPHAVYALTLGTAAKSSK